MPASMPNGRIRLYFDKTIRLDRLNPSQAQMFKLGTVGLASRKLEISRGLNSHGVPAKPLAKGYAIIKSKWTKRLQGRGRNIRDLNFTGDMLREWSLRTVSNKQAFASWTTRKGRIKAWANEQRESFVSWSRENAKAVFSGFAAMIAEAKPTLIKHKDFRSL